MSAFQTKLNILRWLMTEFLFLKMHSNAGRIIQVEVLNNSNDEQNSRFDLIEGH